MCVGVCIHVYIDMYIPDGGLGDVNTLSMPSDTTVTCGTGASVASTFTGPLGEFTGTTGSPGVVLFVAPE